MQYFNVTLSTKLYTMNQNDEDVKLEVLTVSYNDSTFHFREADGGSKLIDGDFLSEQFDYNKITSETTTTFDNMLDAQELFITELNKHIIG